MNKLVLALATMLLMLNAASAYAEDNGGLPEIAGYDDAAIEALDDRIPVDQVMASDVTAETATEATPEVASDNGGLPEIAAYDDAAIEVLPAMVSNK
jgi:hypothetical protein